MKLPLYARAGIEEVWIVDLNRRVLEAHRRPAGSAYQETVTHLPGAEVRPANAPAIGLKLERGFD